MSEFMGLIYGEYDAKSGKSIASQESATVPVSTLTPNEEEAPTTKEAADKMASSGGFQPGGASLHCCMYVVVPYVYLQSSILHSVASSRCRYCTYFRTVDITLCLVINYKCTHFIVALAVQCTSTSTFYQC
jgi:hypothetical protein